MKIMSIFIWLLPNSFLWMVVLVLTMFLPLSVILFHFFSLLHTLYIVAFVLKSVSTSAGFHFHFIRFVYHHHLILFLFNVYRRIYCNCHYFLRSFHSFHLLFVININIIGIERKTAYMLATIDDRRVHGVECKTFA